TPANIFISARVSDSDGSVVQVDFIAGTNLIATRSQPPFSAVWPDVKPGSYQLAALAYDNSGLVSTSAQVRVTVNPPARFRFAQSSYEIGEGDGNVTVTVVNDGLQGGTVNYALVGVNAQVGFNGSGDVDYTQGALEFNNGEPSKS